MAKKHKEVIDNEAVSDSSAQQCMVLTVNRGGVNYLKTIFYSGDSEIEELVLGLFNNEKRKAVGRQIFLIKAEVYSDASGNLEPSVVYNHFDNPKEIPSYLKCFFEKAEFKQ